MPASRPRSESGFSISVFACARARSKQSVGKALTLPSTSAIRFSSTSSRSSGVTSPALSFFDDRASRRPHQLLTDATYDPLFIPLLDSGLYSPVKHFLRISDFGRISAKDDLM